MDYVTVLALCVAGINLGERCNGNKSTNCLSGTMCDPLSFLCGEQAVGLQFSSVQFRSVQFSSVQFSTVQFSAV